ncbi:MAG: Flp family type IVb pilin [Planctomycetaceae bacterium]|nr:Flp family type IVb pilin [Planctomycetaceae bacterium]
MRSFIPLIRSLLTEDDGPTAVEYAVLLMAILMMVIVTVGALGSTSGGLWFSSQTKLEEAGF